MSTLHSEGGAVTSVCCIVSQPGKAFVPELRTVI